MPRREIPHTQGGERRATFYFICQQKRLRNADLTHLLARAFAYARRDDDLDEQMPVIALIESDARDYRYYGTEEVACISRRLASEVLREKLFHELEHERTPGHESHHAPDMLGPGGCAILIGSRGYLAEHARLYLEEHGLLREKAFDAMVAICDLADVEARRVDTCLQVNVWEKDFYPGNFNALAERALPRKFSTAQMLERIGES